jgi:phage terminase large subunit-like protein
MNQVKMDKYKLVMNDLYKFYNYFVINHFNKKIIPAPHIRKLSRELMKMYRGDYKKLTVSMPPRHSKSSLITLAFPLWLISRDPSLNIMVINSTFTLSESFGIRIRDLFHQYGDKLGLRISDKKHASGWIMFEDMDGNLTGGSIRLVGIGGQITGFDADWIIVDDLVKGVQDTTPTVLQKTKDFFNGIVMQRVEPDTRLIVLGTIWHSDDILSYLRAEHSDEYVIMDMPAYDKENNILWHDRYDLNFFKEREKEMGTRLFQALYLCNPLDETGEFFNTEKLQFIEHNELRNYVITSTVRSYDCAYSDETRGEVNDRTASILMSRTIDDYYIIRELAVGRYGENLFNIIKSTARIDTPNIPILIETGTTGGSSKALFDVYRDRLTGYNIQQSKPITSKVDRAFAFKEAILDGKVIVCLGDEARHELLNEMKGFPLMKRDDIIDSCSYAFNYLSSHGDNQVGTSGKRRRAKI